MSSRPQQLRIDELGVWASLFQTEQNGVNIDSEKNDSVESEDVIFVSSSPPTTKNAFEMSRNALKNFFEPALDMLE